MLNHWVMLALVAFDPSEIIDEIDLLGLERTGVSVVRCAPQEIWPAVNVKILEMSHVRSVPNIARFSEVSAF